MKKKTIYFSISLLILNFLFFLPCESDLYCRGPLTNYVQYPFIWFLALIPLSSLALTLTDQKHKIWLKYSGIFFAISMVLVFMSPEYDSGIIGMDRELVNWFFAGLYSIISIIYFIVQYFKKERN